MSVSHVRILCRKLILYFAVVVYGVFVPLGCTVLTVTVYAGFTLTL